jgi:hypothetical protein
LTIVLLDDGHAVYHAYGALSAVQLAGALARCDLVICNTKVVGADGVAPIHRLRGTTTRHADPLPRHYRAVDADGVETTAGRPDHSGANLSPSS